MSKKTKNNLKKKNYKTKKNNLKKKKIYTKNQKAGSDPSPSPNSNYTPRSQSSFGNNSILNMFSNISNTNMEQSSLNNGNISISNISNTNMEQSDKLFTGKVNLPDGAVTEFSSLPYYEDETIDGEIRRGILSKIARDISNLTDEQKQKLIYLIDVHERSDENSEFNNIRREIVTNFNYFLNNLESLNIEHRNLDLENASRLLNILINLTLSIEKLINLILIGRGQNGLPNYSNLFANISDNELQDISSYFVNQLISPFENIINNLIQIQVSQEA